jgi:putative ABC transport system permease protein
MFIGVAMLSPLLVPPIARVAGWPMVKLRGLTGRLAQENAVRNPGRTAVTAAALMIGLALVTFVAVFAEGLKAGVANTIDKNFLGDIVMQHDNGFSPIPAAAGEQVARLDGIDAVSPWRASQGKVAGQSGNRWISGLEPTTANKVFRFEWRKGTPAVLDNLKPGEAVIDIAYGDKHKVDVGDVLSVLTPKGRTVKYTVKGAIKDNADFAGDFIIPLSSIAKDFGEVQDSVVLAKVTPGTPVAPVRKQVDALLKEKFPTVEALNQDELKKKQEKQFDQILALVYALLSLAVFVSIFGIVNTLVLTIHERTRELGLLRAVGMSRRQVRRLVRYESVITALIGGVLGSALGVFLAAVVSRPIADEGFVLKIPVGSIIAFLILAALAGVLAAIPPARRASRLDVLDALAYE